MGFHHMNKPQLIFLSSLDGQGLLGSRTEDPSLTWKSKLLREFAPREARAREKAVVSQEGRGADVM